MDLAVFQKHHEIKTVAELRPHLSYRHNQHFASYWLSRERYSCPSLGVHVHDDRAVAFYIREVGDSGFYSLGPDSDNETEHVEFVIDNYQADEYPMMMVVRSADAFRALEEFLETQKLPTALNWVEC